MAKFVAQMSHRNNYYLYTKAIMPVISMFYGIIIRMFFFDNREHKMPHIHIEFAEFKAVLEIPSGISLP